MNNVKSLRHTVWECKCHILFGPTHDPQKGPLFAGDNPFDRYGFTHPRQAGNQNMMNFHGG